MQAEPTADQTEELFGGLRSLGFLVSCVVGRRHFRTCEGETSNVTDFWNMSRVPAWGAIGGSKYAGEGPFLENSSCGHGSRPPEELSNSRNVVMGLRGFNPLLFP